MKPVEPIVLEGWGIRLEPMLQEHSIAIPPAAADGELWKLRFTFVPSAGDADDYVRSALQGQLEGHMLPWVVRDIASGALIGSTRYHDVLQECERVEIGYTWYALRYQHTRVNPACKLLLMRHAFETLDCAVVGLRTDIENERSQRAIEKLGARKDGIIRHYGLRKDGTVRDTVMYSILRSEWPDVKLRLERRLSATAARP
jgi:RimJ/RimL family protein N-acetyltransferase